MEILLTTAAYAFQIGMILIVAYLLTVLLFVAARRVGVGQKWNYKLICGGLFLFLTAGVVWWTYHPPVFYEPGMRDQIPDENLNTLVAVARGPHSLRMPFWPLYIRVVAEDKILVQYFPAVTVSIECGDGIYSEWVV